MSNNIVIWKIELVNLCIIKYDNIKFINNQQSRESYLWYKKKWAWIILIVWRASICERGWTSIGVVQKRGEDAALCCSLRAPVPDETRSPAAAAAAATDSFFIQQSKEHQHTVWLQFQIALSALNEEYRRI